MTQQQKENNKDIALFMGYKDEGNGKLICPNTGHPTSVWELMYDESWDKLMPVVDKIFKTSLPNCMNVEDLRLALASAEIGRVFAKVVDCINEPSPTKKIFEEYAEFCMRCDREGLPLLSITDFIKQFKN